MARVVVAGLGPAGPDLITDETRRLIDSAGQIRLRTHRHPAASIAPDVPSFDHHYEGADDFDAVYRAIVADLVALAESEGEVLYLVPGSPRVLERTVDWLVADERVEVDVRPAMSFLDLAWVRLGVDPFDAGVRVVDGHRFAERAAGQRGPLLVAHCHNQRVLSDIKLAYEDDEPERVVVLQRLGLPDEQVVELPWAELDRAVEADHLTTLWIPETAPDLASAVVAFHDLVRTLRAECPWDREQTHQSLTRHLLEEAYEVLDAIEHLEVEAGEGFEHLEEELGDLLFQVVFHAVLAAEEGQFTLTGVARGIHDKLRDRHPHVFDPEAGATTVEQLSVDWEARKVAEKGRESVMDGIPAALPALAYAAKVQKKAASQGVDWRSLPGVDAGSLAARLLELVDEARAAGVDAEQALRVAVNALRDAFRTSQRSTGER
ncbi:MAG TPA: MazG family protein [Acidimicrobiales bacterium]|nr:MazG family protein [Acidimicrobiales bacterium]